MKKIIPYIITAAVFCSCDGGTNNNNNSADTSQMLMATAAPANVSYNIVATYPHNTDSYTQGLIWQNNSLYEGTGLERHSKLMMVDLKTGKEQGTVVKNADDIFGEGITMLNGKIYQLSWQNHKVFVYDAKTFAKTGEMNWEHEGWGLTNNGKELIVSTGESTIYFVEPETFKVIRTIAVKDNNGPVGAINELEFVNGVVYANIYETDYIVTINPANGNITGKIDLSGLLEKFGKQVEPNHGLVLNGIAYDSAKNSFYITGKKWPLLFEVKFD